MKKLQLAVGCPIAKVALCAVLLVAAAVAQAPALRTGNTEIGGFVGGSYGIDAFRVMGGGNVSYAVTRVVMPYAEFSYFPGINRVVSQGGQTYNYSVPLYDFHGGVHLRVPLHETHVIPYAVIGFGVVHSLKRSETETVSLGGGSQTFTVQVPAATAPAVNFGGGLRFYLSQRFGLRAEAKGYKPFGDLTQAFGKVEAGIFFQTR